MMMVSCGDFGKVPEIRVDTISLKLTRCASGMCTGVDTKLVSAEPKG